MMKCSYCGGTEFFEGPSGGMSTNVMCAKCRHWFNHTPMLGTLEDLKRVEPTEEEKKEAQVQAAMDESLEQMAIYNEGAEICRSGKLAIACLTDRDYGNYGAAASNLIRLAGYVDAKYKFTETRN